MIPITRVKFFLKMQGVFLEKQNAHSLAKKQAFCFSKQPL